MKESQTSTPRKHRRIATIISVAVVFLLVAVIVRSGHPDEERARRDFLAEHPTYGIQRVALEEHEVAAMSYRIFYRIPGDSTLHEEFRQYLHSDDQWGNSHRRQDR